MNEEKFQEVTQKLDIDPKVTEKARTKKHKYSFLVYPLVQLGVFLSSFFSNFLPHVNNNIDWSPTYPYNKVGSVLTATLLNPINYVLLGLNLGYSYFKGEKIGFKRRYTIPLAILNFLAVMITFIAIRASTIESIAESLAGSGMAVDYGVFKQRNSQSMGIK